MRHLKKFNEGDSYKEEKSKLFDDLFGKSGEEMKIGKKDSNITITSDMGLEIVHLIEELIEGGLIDEGRNGLDLDGDEVIKKLDSIRVELVRKINTL